MSILEVVVLHAGDAERAEAGGADRIELRGSLDGDGFAPEPALVEKVRRATSIHLRPLLRLREGFRTDGGEFTRLKGLASAYLDAGADGIVLGFLDGHTNVDCEVVNALVGDATWPWTFDHAVDHCLDQDEAWERLLTLPNLDQVLTAGSVRGVEQGLDDLLRRAKADPAVARLIMAGGDLKPEHVPWLVRAGVRSFHVGRSVRPGGSLKAWVDSDLVRGWRDLIDDTIGHLRGRQ